MFKEIKENGKYQIFVDGKLLLTIEELGNNAYKATNDSFTITAEVVPLDDYRTQLRCIEHKRADKNGVYRKTTKLLEHNMSWLDYILEDKGFIRKKKCVS